MNPLTKVLAKALVATALMLLLGSNHTPLFSQDVTRLFGERLGDDGEFMQINGRVVDDAGRGVNGATVVMRRAGYSVDLDLNAHELSKAPDLAETETAGGGRFTLPYHPPRFRSILVHRSGYAPAYFEWRVRPAEIVLHRGQSLSGTVVDDRDRPVADATVSLWFWFSYAQNELVRYTRWRTLIAPNWLPGSKIKIETQTDSRGRFELEHLPPDQWVVLVVDKPGYYLQPVLMDTGGDPLFVPADSGGAYLADGGTVRLKPAAEITISAVSRDTGAPVRLKWAAARNQQESSYPEAWTTGTQAEVDGSRATFGRLLPGNHRLWVVPEDDAGYSGVAVDLEIPDEPGRPVSERVRLPRGVAIEGRVVDDRSGEGIAEVGLVYTPRTAGELRELEAFVPPATTDEEGRYSMVVPPIAAEIAVYSSVDGYLSFATFRGGRAMTIPDEMKREINPSVGRRHEPVEFRLIRTPWVVGQVLDAEGRPVRGAIWQATQFYGEANAGVRAGNADDEGRFEIKHLFNQAGHTYDRPGHMRKAIEAGRVTDERWLARYDYRNRVIFWSPDGRQTATVVVPYPGRPVAEIPIEVQLQPAARISGRFVDQYTGGGISGITVLPTWVFSQTVAFVGPSATTNQDGEFTLECVPANVTLQLMLEGQWVRFPTMPHHGMLLVRYGEHLDLGALTAVDLSHLDNPIEVPDVSRMRSAEALATLLQQFDQRQETVREIQLDTTFRIADELAIYESRLARTFGRPLMELAQRQPGSEFEFQVLTEALSRVNRHHVRDKWIDEALDVLIERHVDRAGRAEPIMQMIGLDVERNRVVLERSRTAEAQALAALRLVQHDVELRFLRYRDSIHQLSEAEFTRRLQRAEQLWQRLLGEWSQHSAGRENSYRSVGAVTEQHLQELRDRLTDYPTHLQNRARRVIRTIDQAIEAAR